MNTPKMTTRRMRRTWGPVIGILVCGRCGKRDIGQVRRDPDGADWLAVTSHRWRIGIATRGPRGNNPDAFDMHDLATATEARAWCHKCAQWWPIDLDSTRERTRTATPTHPVRIVLSDQPPR